MKQASGRGPGGPAQVKITAGTEDDLLAIVGILDYTAASSIARFETRPVSVAERRDWLGQFSAAGPYRLVVARGRVFRSSSPPPAGFLTGTWTPQPAPSYPESASR